MSRIGSGLQSVVSDPNEPEIIGLPFMLARSEMRVFHFTLFRDRRPEAYGRTDRLPGDGSNRALRNLLDEACYLTQIAPESISESRQHIETMWWVQATPARDVYRGGKTSLIQ